MLEIWGLSLKCQDLGPNVSSFTNLHITCAIGLLFGGFLLRLVQEIATRGRVSQFDQAFCREENCRESSLLLLRKLALAYKHICLFFAIALAVLGSSSQSSAQLLAPESIRTPASVAVTNKLAKSESAGLLSFEQMKRLDAETRGLYLVGVQYMMEDISNAERITGLKYEVDPKKPAVWMRWFAPEAYAAVTDKSCIYGGNISERDFNNVYCKRPPVTNSACKDKVQCNELLYGPGVCVPPGNSATSQCTRNSKPLEELGQAVMASAASKKQWNEFVADLNSYCKKGTEGPQVEICRMIQGRAVQIEDKAAGRRSPAAATQASTRTATVTGTTVVRSQSIQTRTQVVVARRQVPSSEAPPQGPQSSQECDPFSEKCCSVSDLMGNEFSGYSQGLSLSEAQRVMCDPNPPDPRWIAQIRSRLSRVTGAGNAGRFAQSLSKTAIENFDFCSAHMNKMRATRQMSPPSNRAQVLDYQSTTGIRGLVYLNMGGGASSVFDSGNLVGGLSHFNLTICDVSDGRGSGYGGYTSGATYGSQPNYQHIPVFPTDCAGQDMDACSDKLGRGEPPPVAPRSTRHKRAPK
jgi:hypothetical protein